MFPLIESSHHKKTFDIIKALPLDFRGTAYLYLAHSMLSEKIKALIFQRTFLD